MRSTESSRERYERGQNTYKCPKCGEVFEVWCANPTASKLCECPLCATKSPRVGQMKGLPR